MASWATAMPEEGKGDREVTRKFEERRRQMRRKRKRRAFARKVQVALWYTLGALVLVLLAGAFGAVVAAVVRDGNPFLFVALLVIVVLFAIIIVEVYLGGD